MTGQKSSWSTWLGDKMEISEHVINPSSNGLHVSHVVSGYLPVQVSCSRCLPIQLLNLSRAWVCTTMRLPLMAGENQSVQCSASDLHAQQTLCVHHSGSALNVLTSRGKKKKPVHQKPSMWHTQAFSKDISHNETATKPNITDNRTATKALWPSLLFTAACVRGKTN